MLQQKTKLIRKVKRYQRVGNGNEAIKTKLFSLVFLGETLDTKDIKE